MSRVLAVDVVDVRFPTSRSGAGSDAMHTDPDYSCAYVALRTDGPHDGHGLAFTIGRGTEVVAAAVRALAPHVEGRPVADLVHDLGGLARALAHDSQLRWIGPEKGVIHLATAALVNAAWDLRARVDGLPLWRLVAEMTPEELVAALDFRYLTDALTPAQALDLLTAQAPSRAERVADAERHGYPAYTTSAGWLGYGDEEVRRRVREAVADGFTHVKVKVGADPDDDARRLAAVRAELGPSGTLMVDANQRWDVPEAIERIRALAPFEPWWAEEPTSPDDVLGHAAIARAVAPVQVATGEHAQNRVIFKQLLQARAVGIAQPDTCRLGGVNEVLAVLLLCARFGVPACFHAGGVGLCEHAAHLALVDYVCISGTTEGRVCEWVDHLHEHFTDPARVAGGRYRAPAQPGYSGRLRAESVADHRFPDGPLWAGHEPLRR